MKGTMPQIEFKKKGSRKKIPKIYKDKKIRLKTTLHKLGYPQPPYTAEQVEVFLKNITAKYIISLESKITNDWHLFAEYNNTIDTLRDQLKRKDKQIDDLKECSDIIVDKYETEVKLLMAKLRKVMN
tara:strand:+ start:643 stop:1023 length:381 start_codon:yes stop_codon:yes gene_type:complete